MKNSEFTFSVAECSEFPSLGECYEGIQSVEEAVRLYKRIPPERMNGIPAINIVAEDGGEVGIVSGNYIDIGCLKYLPSLQDGPEVKDTLEYLIREFPDKMVFKIR